MIIKLNNIAKLMLISSAVFSLNARDMDFFGIDNFFEQVQQEINQIRSEFSKINGNIIDESQQSLRKSQKELEKIQPVVTHTKDSVQISFPIGENINKKDISLTRENGYVLGNIETEHGRINFAIDNNYLEFSRTFAIKKKLNNKQKQNQKQSKKIEISSDEKEPVINSKNNNNKNNNNKNNSAQNQNQEPEQEQEIVRYVNGAKFVTSLPYTVNLKSLDAQIKDNNLIITINKKKQEKINIKVNNQK